MPSWNHAVLPLVSWSGVGDEAPHARIHMYVTHAQFERDAMKPGAHEQLHPGSRERLPTDVGNSVLYTDP